MFIFFRQAEQFPSLVEHISHNIARLVFTILLHFIHFLLAGIMANFEQVEQNISTKWHIIVMFPYLPWLNEKEEKKKQNQEPLYQELPLPSPIQEKPKDKEGSEDKRDGVIIIEVF
jgi:hypothetical protein